MGLEKLIPAFFLIAVLVLVLPGFLRSNSKSKQFRLKAKGMPYMRGSGFGDLYVQVNTEVPISLNKEQKELLEKFREIENEKSNPSIKKFFQKAKSFWKN